MSLSIFHKIVFVDRVTLRFDYTIVCKQAARFQSHSLISLNTITSSLMTCFTCSLRNLHCDCMTYHQQIPSTNTCIEFDPIRRLGVCSTFRLCFTYAWLVFNVRIAVCSVTCHTQTHSRGFVSLFSWSPWCQQAHTMTWRRNTKHTVTQGTLLA